MLEILKKSYINIIIASIYTTLAALVYGIWSYSAWQLWYVTFIIVLVIVAIGTVIGFLWVKHEIIKK